jgi:uncharacterized protein (DUF362 family)
MKPHRTTSEPEEAKIAAPEPSHELSRRDFLRLAALGLGAVALDGILGACGQSIPGVTSTPASPSPGSPGGSPSATAGASEALPVSPLPSSSPAASGALPDLVIARNGEPDALVRGAITALGGMDRFVPKGANVIVKPNICVDYRTYEYAATTNPWVVGTLVKMAFEAGAGSVRVMDYPFGGTAAAAYSKSGIGQQVEAAGGQMVVMSSRKFVSTAIPGGKWLKGTEVYDEILKADVLINVPIVKRHGSSVITAGMKNLMGVVSDPGAMHGSLGQAIADLNTLIKPDLTVIDAVRVLTANGPTGGKLSYVKKLDVVAASTDIVAADTYAAAVLGLKPENVDHIRIGAAMGLGQSDLAKLKIADFSV